MASGCERQRRPGHWHGQRDVRARLPKWQHTASTSSPWPPFRQHPCPYRCCCRRQRRRWRRRRAIRRPPPLPLLPPGPASGGAILPAENLYKHPFTYLGVVSKDRTFLAPLLLPAAFLGALIAIEPVAAGAFRCKRLLQATEASSGAPLGPFKRLGLGWRQCRVLGFSNKVWCNRSILESQMGKCASARTAERLAADPAGAAFPASARAQPSPPPDLAQRVPKRAVINACSCLRHRRAQHPWLHSLAASACTSSLAVVTAKLGPTLQEPG